MAVKKYKPLLIPHAFEQRVANAVGRTKTSLASAAESITRAKNLIKTSREVIQETRRLRQLRVHDKESA